MLTVCQKNEFWIEKCLNSFKRRNKYGYRISCTKEKITPHSTPDWFYSK
jgi:hypothetical protein